MKSQFFRTALAAMVLSAGLAVQAQDEPAPAQMYSVQSGDTLSRVVQKLYPNSPLREQLLSDALKAANPNAFMKGKPNVLLAGAMLKVPNHVAMVEQQFKLVSAPAPGEDASEDPLRKWVRFP